MAGTLDVYLHGRQAGILQEDQDGLLEFTYEPQYIQWPESMPLSLSLPLRTAPYDFRACRGFFGGILPEGEVRNIIARNLGISARNDFAMLNLIGGECAGAITFMPAGQLYIDTEYDYRVLAAGELEKILVELPRRPLLAGEHGLRLSLAGAQDKLAVFVTGEHISIPLGHAPSTHLLKPDHQQFKGLAWNEAFCMSLAKQMGLDVASVSLQQAGAVDYLLVERYDRSGIPGSPSSYRRIHQEDFCQALGMVSERKYQREGGPSLTQCFSLLRAHSTRPLLDVQRLIDGVIFNLLIGNHDAHAKNYSLLYTLSSSGSLIVQLAPLYDLVCTDLYPELDKLMAMEIGGKYKSSEIKSVHVEKLAIDAGLSLALAKRRFISIADQMISTLGISTRLNEKQAVVAKHIHDRCIDLLARFR